MKSGNMNKTGSEGSTDSTKNLTVANAAVNEDTILLVDKINIYALLTLLTDTTVKNITKYIIILW
jgi:hypothetical protein